jgi:hypothetical protein
MQMSYVYLLPFSFSCLCFDTSSQFFVRNMMQDWSDADCIKILAHLRDASQPTTQLVIGGDIILHACDEPAIEDIPGAAYPSTPPPLQPNLGIANAIPYLMDIEVLAAEISR